MTPAALEAREIRKVFPGGAEAVANVDLAVARGEMVVLLGPSGCGKSTLLRMVAGIETPTSGRIFIEGEDVTGLPPQRRDVAMVFQNYALYPHLSVRENLAFGLRMRGLPKSEITARVDEVARMLDLEPLLARRPSQLSGGQRQRVALGRAIGRKAKVFLLDEPLSNLDVQLRVNTRMELARLHRSLDAPMLYVTHDQEEAMTLGDRVVVMRAGRTLQVGTPMEVYARPGTSFVGGFVGSPRMNFLPALLTAAPGGAKLDALGGALRLELAGIAAPGPGTRVLLGIRPEDLEITPPGSADLDARVDIVEPLGRESLLHLVAEGTPDESPVEIRVLAPGTASPAPGEKVGLRLQRDRVHLFDQDTEARIN
jgi:ABC-type sugar transport system ATPase subunit